MLSGDKLMFVYDLRYASVYEPPLSSVDVFREADSESSRLASSPADTSPAFDSSFKLNKILSCTEPESKTNFSQRLRRVLNPLGGGMTDSIREQLARRLALSCWRASSLAHYSEDFVPSPCWFAAADECLRQMEWAHRLNCHTSTGCVCYCSSPVSLAPPDWKPPANPLAEEYP